MKNRQQSCKNNLSLILILSLPFTGCTTSKVSPPSYAYKPRIKINQKSPTADQPVITTNPDSHTTDPSIISEAHP